MNSINQFILAEGKEARKEIDVKKTTSKKTFVNLKDGQSLRGFLLTTKFQMYMCHNDFIRNIKSHTCKNPNNKKGILCMSCQHGIKRTKKTLVPFFNVDTQQIEMFDASNNAMKAINSFIDQYEEDSIDTPIVLRRSGNGKDTTYTLMPIRVKVTEKLLFEKPVDILLDAEFYNSYLFVPSNDYHRKMLNLDVI